MDSTELLGLGAALFTTVANIPQTYKIIKTKSTKDISVVTYAILFTGLSIWVFYGFLREDLPIILSNGISALICVLIIILKYISKEKLDTLNDTIISKKDNS